MKSVRDMVMKAREQVEQVSPTVAAEEISTGNVTLIDVREPVEWEHHIDGAFQIPRGLLEFVGDPECGPHLPASLKYELDPTRRTITYCNSGGRATLAALTLQDMGFENVANLDGGFTAWKEAGLPTAEHHAGIV